MGRGHCKVQGNFVRMSAALPCAKHHGRGPHVLLCLGRSRSMLVAQGLAYPRGIPIWMIHCMVTQPVMLLSHFVTDSMLLSAIQSHAHAHTHAAYTHITQDSVHRSCGTESGPYSSFHAHI